MGEMGLGGPEGAASVRAVECEGSRAGRGECGRDGLTRICVHSITHHSLSVAGVAIASAASRSSGQGLLASSAVAFAFAFAVAVAFAFVVTFVFVSSFIMENAEMECTCDR
jgi:hypothetical protein